ncbi:MAG: murein biosynthesis integral membrane protein MurJ [Microbacteriaceae bacterium]
MASIGRASMALASGTLVSRVLGFVNLFVLAQAIGLVGVGANTFAVANQLPNNIYVIVAGGVLNAVLVPQIVRASVHADGGRGYINKLLTLAIMILAATTLLATILAPVLVRISASQWSSDQLALATAFAYWCLPQIFFYGLYTVLGEILNARKSFGPFTWAPVVNNIVAIAGYIVFIALFGADNDGHRAVGDWTQQMISTLGGTATAGVAVQALILFLFWRRVGLHYRPDFHWRGVGLRDAGRMASWTFGMLIVTQLAGLVDTNVASRATGLDASVAVLAKAWLIFMLPHSIVTVSIATVYFTRMSEYGSTGRIQELKNDLSAAMRSVSLLIVLAGAVLLVVAYPFSRLFVSDWTQVQSMGNVIIAYLIGLLPFSLLFLVQRAFYALGNTKTPFYFTLFQAVFFSAMTLACLALPSPLIALGIAAAMTIATTAQFVLATVLLRRKIGELDLRRVGISVLRYLAAGIPALIAGIVLLLLLGGGHPGGFAVGGFLGATASMAIIGLVMAVLYLALLRLLRSPELAEAVTPLLSRLRQR